MTDQEKKNAYLADLAEQLAKEIDSPETMLMDLHVLQRMKQEAIHHQDYVKRQTKNFGFEFDDSTYESCVAELTAKMAKLQSLKMEVESYDSDLEAYRKRRGDSGEAA